MTTEKQIQANRRNGALSRGPKTAQGKAKSRRNALAHGLASKVVIDAEKIELIETLARHLRRDTPPDIAREVAVAEIELRYVRHYRQQLFAATDAAAVSAVADGAAVIGIEEADSAADQLSVALDRILKSERYARRAQTKLKRALRRKIEEK
jgi:hypothetical protein